MDEFKKNMANPYLQGMIAEAEKQKQQYFIAGAAWALELLDKAHPEWLLRSEIPKILKEVPDERAVEPATSEA